MGLIQISASNKVPEFWCSFVMIVLESFGCHILDLVAKLVNTPSGMTTKMTKTLFSHLYRLHMALFFISGGTFHSLPKRFAGIKYVSIRPQTSFFQIGTYFKLMGMLSLSQLAVSGIANLLDIYSKAQRNSPFAADSADMCVGEVPFASAASLTCPLCLAATRYNASTACGHVFCWSCILLHLSTNCSCPLCGQEVQATRIIALHPFR